MVGTLSRGTPRDAGDYALAVSLLQSLGPLLLLDLRKVLLLPSYTKVVWRRRTALSTTLTQGSTMLSY